MSIGELTLSFRFECTNQGHLLLSDPASYSERMFSWFPLLFPIRQPVHVQVCVFRTFL